VLWDVFVNLVLRHGHKHAERRMLRYLIGGLELTPNRPTFTQARDGIIGAVSAIDATDLDPVWRGFAGRGMGLGAVSPPSDSETLNDARDSAEIPDQLPAADTIATLVALDQAL
jgi:extracellular elastinolytic metalloproteinase